MVKLSAREKKDIVEFLEQLLKDPTIDVRWGWRKKICKHMISNIPYTFVTGTILRIETTHEPQKQHAAMVVSSYGNGVI